MPFCVLAALSNHLDLIHSSLLTNLNSFSLTLFYSQYTLNLVGFFYIMLAFFEPSGETEHYALFEHFCRIFLENLILFLSNKIA